MLGVKILTSYRQMGLEKNGEKVTIVEHRKHYKAKECQNSNLTVE